MMKELKILITVIILILLGISIVKISNNNYIKKFVKTRNEYPWVKKEDFFEGKVTYIYNMPRTRNNSFFQYFVINDTIKLSMHAVHMAKDSFDIVLDDVLQEGSLISKKKGSNVVNIKSYNPEDTNTYHFKFYIPKGWIK